jgi:hypothetical protein
MRAGAIAIGAAVITTALFGCDTTPVRGDPELASRQISQNMTESDVVARIGAPPKSISMQTCGGDSGRPWQCKVYRYDHDAHVLWIYFMYAGGGVWVVNNWIVV